MGPFLTITLTMLFMPISICNFIYILDIMVHGYNTCQVVFGKFYMLLGDSHYLQFGALAWLPSTKLVSMFIQTNMYAK